MTIHDVWEQVFPAEKRWLGLVIGVSLGLHVLGLVVLDVRWPQGARFPERPRQAILMSGSVGWGGAGGEGADAWLRWKDPSIIAVPRSPLPEIPEIEEMHAPVERWELPPELRDAVPLMPDEEEISLREEIERMTRDRRARPASVPEVAPSPLSGSRVEMDGALADRQIVKRVELPRPRTAESLRVTVLMLGVRPDGGVDSVFIEESCRDASVDQEGVKVLKQWRFAPRESEGMDYGRVIIYWDLVAEPAGTDSPVHPYTF